MSKIRVFDIWAVVIKTSQMLCYRGDIFQNIEVSRTYLIVT